MQLIRNSEVVEDYDTDELVGEVFDYWWTLVSCFVGLG